MNVFVTRRMLEKLFSQMGMFLVTLFIMSSTCLASDCLSTETKKDAVRALTLEQALALAAEYNKDIQKAQEYQNWVNGRYIEERARALPHLTITGNVNRSRDESQKAFEEFLPLEQDTGVSQITLNQVLFTWGQVGAAIRAAKFGLQTAHDQLKLFQQAVARDVSTVFYDALMADELAAIAEQNLQQKMRHLEEARRKYSAGTATDYDVLASEVAVTNARPEIARTENLVTISRERLGTLVGLEGRLIDIKGSLKVEITPCPDRQQAFSTAWKNRPEHSDLLHRMQVQKELVTVAKADNKPRLDLEASWGWKKFDAGDIRGDGEVASAGVYLTFPFFDGQRTKGRVMQAKSDLRSLTLDEEKLRDTISLQLSEALNNLKESSEIVSALSGTVVEAERLVNMAEEGFIYGVKTNLDVQDAQLKLNLARGNLAVASRNYLVAQVTLEWVMGTLNLPIPASKSKSVSP
jgi:hydrophobic/amphiphilic exporter-1 (mainly G- bacteria), HAE1 family